MHNIEKSRFRKGEYIGYAVGTIWYIYKGGIGWYAKAREWYPDSKYPASMTSRTLSDVSIRLDGLYKQ